MSKKKTIFDLYRKNDANFSAEPSSDAWAKLERKLDGKPVAESSGGGGGRFIRMNFMSIAAGLMLVVGAVTFLMLQSKGVSTQAESVAMNDSQGVFYVKDLVLTDSYADFQQEIRVANDYRARFAGGYIPAEKDISEMIADTHSKIQPNRLNQKPSEAIAMNDESSAKERLEEMSDRIQQDLTETYVENSTADYAYEENSIPTPEASYTPSAPAAAPQQNYAPDMPTKKKMRTAKLATPKNSIQNFNWLVGNWEQKMSGMKSVEKWVADSSNTISGAGYLVQGDDTIFTERPTIKQIGDKIYFFQNIDSPNSRVPYELMVQTDSQWIFKNSELNVPSQVILTKGKNNYEFEMRDVPSANAPFLKNRNLIISNSAQRNMARMN